MQMLDILFLYHFPVTMCGHKLVNFYSLTLSASSLFFKNCGANFNMLRIYLLLKVLKQHTKRLVDRLTNVEPYCCVFGWKPFRAAKILLQGQASDPCFHTLVKSKSSCVISYCTFAENFGRWRVDFQWIEPHKNIFYTLQCPTTGGNIPNKGPICPETGHSLRTKRKIHHLACGVEP